MPGPVAVHEIDNCQTRRDLCPRGPLQAVIDLVLKQFRRLVEQIDADEPIRKPPDHFVPAPSDRRQLAKIIEQAERLHRRQSVTFTAEEQAFESGGRLVLDLAGHVGIRMGEQCRPHHMKGVTIAAVFGIKMSEQLEPLGLGLIAAPDGRQRFDVVDDVLAPHAAGCKGEHGFSQPPLRSGTAVARDRSRAITRERILSATQAFVQAAEQHIDGRLQIRRHADGFEIIHEACGIIEIAHSMDERSASFIAIRCNSIGKAPTAALTVLKISRASAHRPCRASAIARQIGASC